MLASPGGVDPLPDSDAGLAAEVVAGELAAAPLWFEIRGSFTAIGFNPHAATKAAITPASNITIAFGRIFMAEI